jgi:hypothetical protein
MRLDELEVAHRAALSRLWWVAGSGHTQHGEMHQLRRTTADCARRFTRIKSDLIAAAHGNQICRVRQPKVIGKALLGAAKPG